MRYAMREKLCNVAEQISKDSLLVDQQFSGRAAETFTNYSLFLPVPTHHPRAEAISQTRFTVGRFQADTLPQDGYLLLDANLKSTVIAKAISESAHYVEATEDTLKELSWLDNFIANNVPQTIASVIGVGGGILLNAAAYIAERQGSDFISVPTTILAAADSAIGGLVRINKI